MRTNNNEEQDNNRQAPPQQRQQQHDNNQDNAGCTSTPQVMPTLATLLVALALAISRWLDWAFRIATPVLTSPRFTGAVKEAGLAALPVVHTVVSEVWRWYTTVEHDKRVMAAAAAGGGGNGGSNNVGIPCNTSQTLTIGINMPAGVSVNVQYTSNNTPAIQQMQSHAQPQQQQQQQMSAPAVMGTTEAGLKALPAPDATTAANNAAEYPDVLPPQSFFGRACDSVTAVSSLPIQTLAIVPLSAPLHPLRFASSVWNASKPSRTLSV